MTPLSGSEGDSSIDTKVDDPYPNSGETSPERIAAEEPLGESEPAEHNRGRQDQPTQVTDTPLNNRDTSGWMILRKCAEVVSTCRVRDAMGHGMEPMMGLLK
jgi:hypothetical protein